MGHKVFVVEPFYDNIVRIHKSATLNRVQDKIVIVQNAVSDKRNEVKLLKADKTNVGAQSLMDFRNVTFVKDTNNKYLVETILLDDLLPLIHIKSSEKQRPKCIVKIDIEGFESYAMHNALAFFEFFDVEVIFMEWHGQRFYPQTLQMIDLFLKNCLAPFELNQNTPFKRQDWESFPNNIIWKKNYLDVVN